MNERDVRQKGKWAVAVVLFLVCAGQVQGETIVQTLGDEDFYGFGGGVIGDNVPAVDFDNSTVSDPAFTDRDLRQSRSGPDSDNDAGWMHDLSGSIGQMTIISAVLQLPIGGIQDASPTVAALDDRVFIEGIEVAGAFDTVDQGAFGTGFFEFVLSEDQLASFAADGLLDVFIDGGKVPADNPVAPNVLDSYFLDYSRVSVMLEVPEPGSTGAVVAGLLWWLVGGWRRGRECFDFV